MLIILAERASAPRLGREGPAHTCVAALAAAGGARLRNVVGIFALSLGGPERSVFSIPPFFSGLGVRERVRLPLGGASVGGEVALCRLVVR